MPILMYKFNTCVIRVTNGGYLHMHTHMCFDRLNFKVNLSKQELEHHMIQ